MHNMQKIGLVFMGATYLGLSGCALVGETQDAQADQSQTKIQASALGALLGAGLGYAIGEEKGAAIGALLGGGAGYALGSEVASRKQSYADREQAIREETVWNEEFTRKVHASNTQLRQDINGHKKQVAQLKSNLRTGKATQADLDKRKKQMQAQEGEAKSALAQVESQLQESKRRYQSYQAGSKGQDMAQWRGKLTKLEQEKNQLEKNIGTLNAMNSGL